MKREDLLKFGHRDKDFMKKIYPFLKEVDKRSLWADSLTFDFWDNTRRHDPLDKFTKENYEKWKTEEPDFDRFLEFIIDEFMPAWGISRVEIYKRIEKKRIPHDTKIKRYQGTLNELATDIGDLRYDALSDFLNLLRDKIKGDGDKDFERGRVNLAKQLHGCADNLKQSKAKIDEAWRISKPFMDI